MIWNVVSILFTIAVSHNTDIKKLKVALLEGARNHPDVLNSPRPFISFENLGGDCLEFRLLFWTEAKDKQLQIKSDLNYRIEANLQRYQIQLANSQQNVYLESPQIEQWFKAWLIRYGFNFSDIEIDKDDYD